MTDPSALSRVARSRERLRALTAGQTPSPAIEPRAATATAPFRPASSRAREPLDVVVTPGELNDLHGTGFLVKRVFAERRGVLSLRVRDDYGGVHDFGDEALRVDVVGARRPDVYAAAIAALDGRSVRAVYSVPYTPADLMLAMAVSDVAHAPLCLWEMDDQCIAVPNVPRPLMREFLEKCRLRLATHTELRDAYEAAFGLPFGVLPAVVPARLVRPSAGRVPRTSGRGALLGSVWSRSWLDALADVLRGSGESLDWYGNHRAPGLRLDDAALAAMPIEAHGVVAEPALADALVQHPFVVVPTDEMHDRATESGAIAALSLPGRILFAAASSQTPVIVVGSDRTPAAAFVLRHGIGRVVPYDAAAFRAAARELRRPEVQAEARARASAIAPALSDEGVGAWLAGSVEDGRPRDDRFERLFPRAAAEAAA